MVVIVCKEKETIKKNIKKIDNLMKCRIKWMNLMWGILKNEYI